MFVHAYMCCGIYSSGQSEELSGILNIPPLGLDASQKAPCVCWISSDHHFDGQFLHLGFDPKDLEAVHPGGNFSDQKYCKPSCLVVYHLLTWTVV